MRERYCLRAVRDQQLLSALSGLVEAGNALNADVLAHLAELDERKLFLELGFSSSFAYCLESLGMDESSAGRRITAARVCRSFLEIDHVTPPAVGGEPRLANLRLRCRAHNQWHAFRFFGRKRIEAAIARRRMNPERSASEPRSAGGAVAATPGVSDPEGWGQ